MAKLTFNVRFVVKPLDGAITDGKNNVFLTRIEAEARVLQLKNARGNFRRRFVVVETTNKGGAL